MSGLTSALGAAAISKEGAGASAKPRGAVLAAAKAEPANSSGRLGDVAADQDAILRGFAAWKWGWPPLPGCRSGTRKASSMAAEPAVEERVPLVPSAWRMAPIIRPRTRPGSR